VIFSHFLHHEDGSRTHFQYALGVILKTKAVHKVKINSLKNYVKPKITLNLNAVNTKGRLKYTSVLQILRDSGLQIGYSLFITSE
jgi:hypothetical protein